MSQDKTTRSVEITKGQIGQAHVEVHMSTLSVELCPLPPPSVWDCRLYWPLSYFVF